MVKPLIALKKNNQTGPHSCQAWRIHVTGAYQHCGCLVRKWETWRIQITIHPLGSKQITTALTNISFSSWTVDCTEREKPKWSGAAEGIPLMFHIRKTRKRAIKTTSPEAVFRPHISAALTMRWSVIVASSSASKQVWTVLFPPLLKPHHLIHFVQDSIHLKIPSKSNVLI